MSNCYKRVNFYDLCRLCAQNIHKNKVKIFEQDGIKHQLQSKIKKCLAINVKSDDFLPKVVCAKCLKQLELCNAFREECLNSESMLSSYFKNYRHTDEFKKSGKVYIKDTVKADSEPVHNTNKKPVITASGVNSPPSSSFNVKNSNQSSETSQPRKPLGPTTGQGMLPYSMDMLNEAFKKAVQQLPKEILKKVIVNSNGEVINLAPVDCMGLEQPHIPNSMSNRATSNGKLKKWPSNKECETEGIIKIDLTDDDGESVRSKFNAMTYCKQSTEQAHIQNPTVIFPGIQFQSNSFVTVPTSTVYPPAISPSTPTVINVICNQPSEMTAVSSATISPPSSVNMDDLRSTQPYSTPKSPKPDTPKAGKTYAETSKGHTCEVCAKTFKRREHLYQHMKLHTGFRPYQCTDCKKTFVRKEHLLRHMVLHSGERNFSCDICTKSFSRHDNLLKHIRIHKKHQSPSEAAYTCDVCHKVYLVKNFYESHRAELGRCFLAPHLRASESARSITKDC